MDIDDVAIKVVEEMTRIPAALKSWKTAVSDLFNDNRVFNCHPDDAAKWKVILKSLFDSDKTAFPELLGKFSLWFSRRDVLIILQGKYLMFRRPTFLPTGSMKCSCGQ